MQPERRHARIRLAPGPVRLARGLGAVRLAALMLAGAALLTASSVRGEECLPEIDFVDGQLLVVIEPAGSPASPSITLADLIGSFNAREAWRGYHLERVTPERPDLDWIPEILVGRVQVVVDDPGMSLAQAVDDAEDAVENAFRSEVDRAEAHEEIDTPEGGQRQIPSLGPSRTMADVLAQPAATLTRVPEAREIATGRGVIVAIIDGEASLTNPELAHVMHGPGLDFVDGSATADVAPNGLDDDGDGLVDEGAYHATHVAGLVHAVAPEARILHVRVLDDEGRGDAFDVAHGMVAAASAGARVINVSLGLPHDNRAVEVAIDWLVGRGVTIVAAGGNRGESLGVPCLDFPASIVPEAPDHPDRDVIAVAAVDDALVKASWSSWGARVDLSAPGEDVLSTWGDDRWGHWDGTSFAAPLVAGGAALILGRYPVMKQSEVQRVLTETAQPDANPPELDGLMGSGVLDLLAIAGADVADRRTLRVEDDPSAAGSARLSWSAMAGATRRDVLRGELGSLRDAGGAIDLGALTCVVDDAASEGGAIDPMTPGVGAAFFYVLRDDEDALDLGRASDGRPRVAAEVACEP